MTDRPARIFVTRRLPEQVLERMQLLFDTRMNDKDQSLTAAQIIAATTDTSVLVSTITDQIDAELIRQLPNSVKLIAQFGNGVDNIDIEAAFARGIMVTNTPSVMSEDTADMAMALILSVPRRLVEGAQTLTGRKQWAGWSPTAMLGRRLSGQSLGIVGLGRIGTAVARRAKAFGLSVHYHSRHQRSPDIEEPLEATYWSSLEAMLKVVDIISIHMPLTEATNGMISRQLLEKLKPEAVLINVSRPELIDEVALIEQLEHNRLAGAGLDVFSNRDGIDPRLVKLAKQNKLVLTPHMASSTLEARIEMGETVIVNIKVFMDGHQPPHRVLAERRADPASPQ